MYFIIVEGESVPTNKIGHSDGVALRGIIPIFHAFSSIISGLEFMVLHLRCCNRGLFYSYHTHKFLFLTTIFPISAFHLCVHSHIVINTQSSLLCGKASRLYSKLQYNVNHLPHVNVYLFQQYQSRLDNAFGKKGSKIQGMVYKVCGFKKTLATLFNFTFYFADHALSMLYFPIMAVSLLFC